MADLERLRAIQDASIEEPWRGLLDSAIGSGGPIVRVIERDRPIGYAVALVAGDTAYVPEVAIAPPYQERGFGSELLTDLATTVQADGVRTLRLTARASDDRVRSFYENHGFSAVDRLPDHFEADDGVVYQWQFDD